MPKRPEGNPNFDGVLVRSQPDEDIIGGDWEELTVKELREIAKELEVTGYSSMDKETLIDAVEAAASE